MASSVSIYAPLPAGCIRVLHLRPSDQLQSPLEGELVTVSTNGASTPEYDALSYAWEGAFSNEPLPGDEIQLAGTKVKIAGNLGDALRRLRCNVENRTLWIDAICIDQDNNAEKSVQVQNMSTVYSKARQVVSWLGEDSTAHDGEAVFHCMEQSLRGTPLAADSKEALAACQAAKKFWTRRYFSRRWIIQEYTLAQSLQIVCGPHSVVWNTSCDFRTWARELVRAGGTGREHVLDPKTLDSKYWQHPDSSSLDNVLIAYHGLGCFDERDKIYALLSLFNHKFKVKVDYTLPWPQVYHRFMQTVIEDIHPAFGFVSRDFTVIYRLLCVAASQAAPDLQGFMESVLPSWVPNWLDSIAAHDAEGLDIYWNPNIFLDYYAGLHGEGAGQYLMLYLEEYEPVSGVLSPGTNIEPIYCPQYAPETGDCVVGPRLANIRNNHREYILAVGGCLLLRPIPMLRDKHRLVGRCSLMTAPGLFRTQRRTFSIL